jgi:erythromycin esterase
MQTVLSEGLSSGSGRYAENRELIQWMRDYNTTAPAAGHHRIRFYGIDLTAGGRISGTTLTIDYALTYLSQANPKGAGDIRLSLGDNLPKDDWSWGMLSPAAQAALDNTIPKIALEMEKSRSSLIAHSSAEEYLWAQHNLEVARQLAQCERLTTPQSFTDIKFAGPVVGCRDQAMADNVRWVVQNSGKRGRLLVFAHNGHIMNWQEDGGHWAEMQEKPFMMGSHLRRTFGKDLVIIATSSSTASAALPTPEPLDDSIDDTLARVGLPKMLLDLRTARQDNAAFAWLSTQRPLHANISTHQLVTPSTALDLLVFLGGLTPSIPSSDPTLN